MQREFILASASPRRKEIFEKLCIPFHIATADVDENIWCAPADMVRMLSERKARAAHAQKGKESVYIGADTIVVLHGETLGKPANEQEAARMLRSLSGRQHIVLTGVFVLDAASGAHRCSHEETKVFFSELNEAEISSYIESQEPMDKAGAYGIQGLGARFIERIEGCFYNVMGLPINRLWRMLKELRLV
ncbi:MAG: Maf family protein [Christensenellales bacterium]|jgi:septum formation protein